MPRVLRPWSSAVTLSVCGQVSTEAPWPWQAYLDITKHQPSMSHPDCGICLEVNFIMSIPGNIAWSSRCLYKETAERYLIALSPLSHIPCRLPTVDQMTPTEDQQASPFSLCRTTSADTLRGSPPTIRTSWSSSSHFDAYTTSCRRDNSWTISE